MLDDVGTGKGLQKFLGGNNPLVRDQERQVGEYLQKAGYVTGPGEKNVEELGKKSNVANEGVKKIGIILVALHRE